MKGHADRHAAKTGGAAAADGLVGDLVEVSGILSLTGMIGGEVPIVASVHAQEAEGVNAIPEALAGVIAERLRLQTDTVIVQSNLVDYSGTDGFSRLARQALFDGDVVVATACLMVDDFIGQGGTLANFRGHIEAGGRRVIEGVALTGKPFSSKPALSDQRLSELRYKHGELEDRWRARFGFGFDAVTESEARYLVGAADADTIRNRVTAAASAADGGGGEVGSGQAARLRGRTGLNGCPRSTPSTPVRRRTPPPPGRA